MQTTLQKHAQHLVSFFVGVDKSPIITVPKYHANKDIHFVTTETLAQRHGASVSNEKYYVSNFFISHVIHYALLKLWVGMAQTHVVVLR